MSEVDHSGLGASYLRSHSDTPIQHPAGAPCGYCAPATPDRLTQAVARSLFAAQLAAIEDEREREQYRMAGNFRAAYAGVAEFRDALSELGFAISPALSEPTLDVAWREAEATLPEGWDLTVMSLRKHIKPERDGPEVYAATASAPTDDEHPYTRVVTSEQGRPRGSKHDATPAAALHALIDRLRAEP